MYTEGFEGLEEAEKESRSSYGLTEQERLLRENEKLKKSLEKEQFFNRLLDQEIQELKMSMPGAAKQDFHSDYWEGSRGVSKGAFYMLLIITLLMAGYIGYGIYYNKPINYLGIGQVSKPETIIQSEPSAVQPEASAPVNPSTNSAAQASDNGNAQTKNEQPSAAAPVVKDSVPNIIGEKKAAAPIEKPKVAQKAAVVPTADEEYNEEEVDRVINEKSSAAPATAVAKPADDNRPSIGKYKVTSKANFYNSPDENSMRGTFISGSANKVVDALEEKNGFIYVVYTNDLGFTSRGWLSKTDLTKE